MSKTYISVLEEFYCRTSGRFKTYKQLCQYSVASKGGRQDLPLTPSILKFAVQNVLHEALFGLLNEGV